jgi:sugar transferase (PEP-CTERM/EpsH1 system associated)
MTTHPPARRSAADRRIRLVHLVITLDVGGLERVLVNHIRHADHARFEISVLCLGGRGRLAEEIEAEGAAVHALEVHGRGLGRGARRLVLELRRLKPDVLHTHNLAAHLLGAAAARIAGVPVVVHTKHGRYDIRSWRRALGMRAASAMSSMVVPVSEDSAHEALEGVSARKIRVIHNGVDVAGITPGDRFSRAPGDRVVSVGRLAAVKDYPTLLRAARRVVDALPSFHLDLVGDGPERTALESLRSELGLDGHVTFLGERHDVRERLQAADVFVLSSTSEGLSLALLEALASGLPIVATRVGGNAQVVTDGETGRLVPPSDPGALAEALIDVLTDRPRQSAMGRAARRRAEEHFSLTAVMGRYESLYSELLGAKSAPSPGVPS